MATENYAYDHPVYRTRIIEGGTTTAGAAAVSNRFASFTAMLAKSAQVTVVTAGTSTANTLQISKVTGTTTSSLASVSLGTSAIGVTTNLTLGNTALAQGDLLCCLNGADATGVSAVTFECVVTPGANVTT